MPRRAGERDDVVDGQEIARIIELLDQRQLVLDQVADLSDRASPPIAGEGWTRRARSDSARACPPPRAGEGCCEPLGGALPGQPARRCCGVMPVGDRLLGIFVAQLVEAEPAALDDLRGCARPRPRWPRNSRAISAAASDAARHWRRGESRPHGSCNARGCRSRHPATAAARACDRARR